jgi:hypothetical protein
VEGGGLQGHDGFGGRRDLDGHREVSLGMSS